jgi:hypothetical protein
MKPINVYNLGEEGVNVDVGDVHLRDGELRSAQNVQIDPAGGLGGVRRRDGMDPLNGTPLAGSVTGVIALPLPDRSQLTRYFYAPIDGSSSNHFRKSSDGTTWANSTEGEVPAERADFGSFGTGAQELYSGALRWQGFKNKLWYPGSDYTNNSTKPTIHVWDGAADYKFADIPNNPNANAVAQGVMSFVPWSENFLLVSTYDATASTGRGRIMLMDIRTGAFSALGPETDLPGLPMNMVVWQGRVWTGLVNLAGGSASTVRWARPEDATWTTDLTLPTTLGYVIDLAVFQGNLYISTAADVGDSAEIRKRTSDGAWSIQYTSDGTGANNFLGPFIVNEDDTEIFAMQSTVSGGAKSATIISSTDGTTWAEEFDIDAEVSSSHAKAGMPILDPDTGDIYWPIKSTGAGDVILKRTAAGVWSSVDSSVDLRGPLGVIRF